MGLPTQKRPPPTKTFLSISPAAPKSTDWSSAGVREKPDACKMCRWLQKGSGFCPDDSPAKAKIAVLLPFPRPDDVIELKPLSGGLGAYFEKSFITGMGHTREEVMGVHVIRCTPPKFKGQYAYPTSTTRSQVENTCRLHDRFHGEKGRLVPGGILEFAPDLFIITHDPADVRKVGCYHRQMECDFRKAWEFAAEGYRPLVLCGIEAIELVAPWLSGRGGTKAWRGHFWVANWPFMSDTNRRGFIAA